MKRQGIIFTASDQKYRQGLVSLKKKAQRVILTKHNISLLLFFLLSLNSFLFSPAVIQSKASAPVVLEEYSLQSLPLKEELIENQESKSSTTSLISALSDIPLPEPTIALIPEAEAVTMNRVGTTLPSASVDVPAFILPLATYTSISSQYSSSHRGIDLTAPSGTPVIAGGNGSIVEAGWSNQGFGLSVVIDHGSNIRTRYAHLSSIAVSLHQQVAQGATIGAVGCTGWCTGNHLHFEIQQGGISLNPFAHLPL